MRYLAAPLARYAISCPSVFTAAVYASAPVNARLVRATERCVAREARVGIASKRITRLAEASGGSSSSGGSQAASDTARFMVLVYAVEKTAGTCTRGRVRYNALVSKVTRELRGGQLYGSNIVTSAVSAGFLNRPAQRRGDHARSARAAVRQPARCTMYRAPYRHAKALPSVRA